MNQQQEPQKSRQQALVRARQVAHSRCLRRLRGLSLIRHQSLFFLQVDIFVWPRKWHRVISVISVIIVIGAKASRLLRLYVFQVVYSLFYKILFWACHFCHSFTLFQVRDFRPWKFGISDLGPEQVRHDGNDGNDGNDGPHSGDKNEVL